MVEDPEATRDTEGREHPTDEWRRLDAREIDGEPFDEIVAALEELPTGNTLLLVTSFEPVPLYDVLKRRGFDHETQQVDEQNWHVRITHA